MSNYDLDEEERRNRQWDAHTQRYISVGDQVDDLLESQKQREQRISYDSSYEKEEVTNPDHYDKVGFAIQPIEYITKNELDFLEGNVIKYVSRYQHKGGINDLLKARTYIEFLITREREKNGD